MTEKNDGGPAFPGYDIYGDGKQHMAGRPHGGMTLRDYFSAKAMQGLLASLGQDDMTGFSDLASDAWAMADAMLKRRGK